MFTEMAGVKTTEIKIFYSKLRVTTDSICAPDQGFVFKFDIFQSIMLPYQIYSDQLTYTYP